jgi:hypothetical protein
MPTGRYPYAYPAPPPPRRRHRWLLIGVVVVVAILLIGAVAFILTAPPEIDVTVINFVSPDNVCGLDGAQDYGFNGSAGSSLEFTYLLLNFLPNNATTSCTIANITTTTSGFSVTGANTPLTIPAGANATATFYFQVNFPSTGYTGALTLVLT